MTSRTLRLACMIAIVITGGCSQSAAPAITLVEGIVLLNGKPLPKAVVQFHPLIDNAGFLATGVTDDRGRFTLTCNGQTGACVCEHRVVVQEADIPAELTDEAVQDQLAFYLKSLVNRPIPAIYTGLVSSPLRVTVTADQKYYTIELRIK